MLPQTVLLSLVAAAAALVPNVQITPAPQVRRDVFDSINDGIDKVNSVGDKIGSAGDKIESVGDNLKSKGDNLKSKGEDVASSVRNGISTAVGKVKSAGDKLENAASCGSFMLKVLTGAPTDIPTVIATEITSTPTNICFASALPNSIISEYSKYESSVVEWYTSHSDDIKAIETQCPSSEESLRKVLSSLKPCATALKNHGVKEQDNKGDNKDNSAGARAVGLSLGAAAFAVLAGAALL